MRACANYYNLCVRSVFHFIARVCSLARGKVFRGHNPLAWHVRAQGYDDKSSSSVVSSVSATGFVRGRI